MTWDRVRVITKPADEPITVAAVKERLRIDEDADDDLLAAYLRGCVARIDGPSGIGYAMMTQSWRLTLDAFPHTICLPGAPIKSVDAIKYIDTDGAEQTMDAADYRADLDGDPVRIEPAFGKSWPSIRHVIGAVKIEYTLGEDDATDVAPDLIDAVTLLVGHRYANREAVVVGVTATVLPMAVEAIVSEYRRGVVG